MFGAIGEIFGNLFGTEKAAVRVVDSVSNGIDKLFYTDEEKAEDHAAAISEGRKFLISWLDTTKGQNIARRLIALLVIITWLSMYWFMVVARFLGIWIEKASVQLKESAELFGSRATDMQDAVWLIMLFYFAAPHMGQVINVLMDRVTSRFKKQK
jgi:hypothetical protein